MTIDPNELRNALGGFLTGVTVVATRDPSGTPLGFTANSFTSVSLEPPLVLFCIARSVSSYPVFENVPSFAVSVLSRSQRDVARLFAGKQGPRFEKSSWREDETGSPIIDGALAWFDCSVFARHEAGDHLVVIGEVLSFGYERKQPLSFLRGSFVEAPWIGWQGASRNLPPGSLGGMFEHVDYVPDARVKPGKEFDA